MPRATQHASHRKATNSCPIHLLEPLPRRNGQLWGVPHGPLYTATTVANRLTRVGRPRSFVSLGFALSARLVFARRHHSTHARSRDYQVPSSGGCRGRWWPWPQLSQRHGPTHGVFPSKGRCSATAAQLGRGLGNARMWNSLISPFVRRQFVPSFDCIRLAAAVDLRGCLSFYQRTEPLISTCIAQRWKKKKGWGGSDTGQTLKGGCSGRCHRRCDNQATLGSHRPVSVHAAVPHEEFGEGGDEKETRKVTRDPARYAICSCNALALPPPSPPSLGKGGGGWGVGGRTVLSGNMPTGYRQSKATSKGSTEGISCKAARTGQNKATELLFCTFDHPWFWFWSVGRSLACAMWCVYWPMLNVLMCCCATLERGEVGRYVQVCDSRSCLVIPLAYLLALSTPTHPETQRRECGGVVVQSLAQPERSGEYIPMLLAWFVCQRETSGKPI